MFFAPVSEAAAETTDIVWPANLGAGGMEVTQEVVGTWGAGSAGDMDGTSSVSPPCRMLQRWGTASGCFQDEIWGWFTLGWLLPLSGCG